MKGAPRVRKDRTRRGTFPRVSSVAGVLARQEARTATTPKDTQGMHFIKPGSRNPRKVTRLCEWS